MDFSTTLGMVLGSLLLSVSILMGGRADLFVSISSVFITIGGAFSATMIAFPLEQIRQTLSITRKAFKKALYSHVDMISTLVDFAITARRDGILALEDKANESKNDFLKKGFLLAVDGTSPEILRDIMETEISYLEQRHKKGSEIFATLATFAPAFGLIGTLIGLVQMLSQMSNPKAIGPGMAVAILTTLYGAVIANLFCLPLEKKLKVRSQEEVLEKELILQGILAIQAGDNPRIVEEKLKAFLSPNVRKSVSGWKKKK
jgi:chemotaxis protein MotA